MYTGKKGGIIEPMVLLFSLNARAFSNPVRPVHSLTTSSAPRPPDHLFQLKGPIRQFQMLETFTGQKWCQVQIQYPRKIN
jgi:hypothetical protein